MSPYHSRCRQANSRINLEKVDVEKIYAEKRQIKQVLLNMINNDCEAVEKKRRQWYDSCFRQKEKSRSYDQNPG
ncbi:MAG: hypothetical protein JRF20_09890 [Deltaproteobacteria bacterium]|nr:hypothetical protein [Deltaproteobacteria bacterium]